MNAGNNNITPSGNESITSQSTGANWHSDSGAQIKTPMSMFRVNCIPWKPTKTTTHDR